MISISPRGKLVLWWESESGSTQGRTYHRWFVTGKPGSWTYGLQPIHSTHESRYEYFITQKRDNGKPALIIDGKEAAYEGQAPFFTAHGSTVIATNRGPKQEVFVNGKPILDGVSLTKSFGSDRCDGARGDQSQHHGNDRDGLGRRHHGPTATARCSSTPAPAPPEHWRNW